MVDRVLYDAYLFQDDVLHCSTPLVEEGALIRVVLLANQALEEAKKGPVKLSTSVIATLNDTDVVPLPQSISLNGSRYARDQLQLVTVGRHTLATEETSDHRWRFCIMTQIAPSAWLLPQWVSYHRRIGIDHIYIFDNGAKENIPDMFTGRNDVEVLNWPFHKCQLQLIAWFQWMARSRCESVMHIDVDEFLMIGLGNRTEYQQARPLPYFATHVWDQGYESFKIPYIIMCNHGYRLNPRGFLAENYMQRAGYQWFHNGKAMCSTAVIYESGLVHSCGKVNGRVVRFHMPKILKWGDVNMYPEARGEFPFVVHFRERSWEEWVEKSNAGWVVGGLVADSNKGTLDVESPPDRYMRVDETMMYTHFRGLWRRVMTEGDDWEKIASLGCRQVLVDDGAVVEDSCEQYNSE